MPDTTAAATLGYTPKTTYRQDLPRQARHQQMLGLWIDANSRVEAALGAASADQLRGLADRIASD